MAIKLKGSKLGVILCIFLFLGSVGIAGYEGLKIESNRDYIKAHNYSDTLWFRGELSQYVNNIANSYINYGESENSEKINNVTEEDIKIKKSSYDEKYEQGITELGKDRDNKYLPLNPSGESYDYSYLEIGTITDYYNGIDKLKILYVKNDEEIKNDILEERKEKYAQLEEELANWKNIKYAIYDNDEIVKTNIDAQDRVDNSLTNLINESQMYFTLDGSKSGSLFFNVEGTVLSDYFNYYSDNYRVLKENKLKLTIIIPKVLSYEDYFKYGVNSFVENKKNLKFDIGIIVVCTLITIGSLVYIIKFRKKLFIFTQKDYSKKLIYRLYKKLWLEIKLLLLFFMFIPWFVVMLGLGYTVLQIIETFIYNLIPSILIIIFTFEILVLTYRTLIKEIDEKGLKQVIKETSLSYRIYSLIKQSFIIKSVGVKISIFVISTFIFIIDLMVTSIIINTRHIYDINALAYTFIGGVYVFLYLSTVGYLGFKFIGGFNKIVLGAHKIAEGDLNYQIEGSSIQVIDTLATDINNMRNGLEKAIKNEVKSERMKTELITNVSHDLKTPLTSIINYVDLIKKGDFSKEEIKDYIKIIDRKSQRLKVLIEDLFEASSAASGEMELNIEKLNIVALLKQSIAEFEEKIKMSKLDFRINLPNEKVYVMVDGRRTWRIFENQLSNILKYSLDNTRVYINLEEDQDWYKIIFKNISAYEIDFNEDEITERFKRGDQSRHTEGSGLGLAISKGLTELQGGIFRVNVDGDLFKVEIELKKA